MKKATIVTYGCQMNVNESEKARTLLSEMGYEFCEKVSEADLVMLNTCTIREGAAKKIYGKLGELKTIRNRGKHQVVIVSGCLAQEEGEELLHKWKHVNIVVGNQNIYLLTEAIHKIEYQGFKQILLTEDLDLLPPMIFPEHNTPTSAYVSITYGCNNYCAYCIVPYVRGRERSEPMENVITQINMLLKKGVKEIILLG
ncbi:MAG: radical SAM protein, partial [Fusobacteria bacterium]|nr:radical SAM protein [Fusobacteriota bacterium]